MKAGVSPVNHGTLPSPKTKTSQVKQGNDLSVVLLNARSVKTVKQSVNKVRDLQNLVYSADCDVLAITETWLTSIVSNSELIPQGYTIHRMDRPGDKIGGGALIAVKNSLSSSTCETPVTDEILAVNVTLNQNCNITFICTYKPPNANNSLFNTNLQAVLSSATKKKF